jgi:hypothetical protein
MFRFAIFEAAYLFFFAFAFFLAGILFSSRLSRSFSASKSGGARIHHHV